jgi:hypothetical protein
MKAKAVYSSEKLIVFTKLQDVTSPENFGLNFAKFYRNTKLWLDDLKRKDKLGASLKMR